MSKRRIWSCSKSLACFAFVLLVGCQASSGQTGPFRAINYYARDHAWEAFWDDWPQTQDAMRVDMPIIRDLGANTVRLFVHPASFGWSHGGPAGVPDSTQLQRIDETLAILDQNGLKARLCLFDLFDEQNFGMIAESVAWMTPLMSRFRDDPRIAMWELKNEVDMTKPTVRNWVLGVFPEFKRLASKTPVSISISAADSDGGTWQENLKDLVGNISTADYYDVHFYPRGDIVWTTPIEANINDAVAIVGVPRLLAHEIGQTTWAYHAEESQRDALQTLFYYGDKAGIQSFGVWAYEDFPKGTMKGPGPALGDELAYGLYDLQWRAKPAVAVVSDMFHDIPPTSLPASAVLYNSSFEIADGRTDVSANGKVEVLKGWQSWNWDSTWGTVELVRDLVRSRTGAFSARLTTEATAAGVEIGFFQVPAWPVQPGQTLSMSGYAWLDDLPAGSTVHLTASWLDANGSWFDNTDEAAVVGATGEWAPMSLTITVPGNAAYLQMFAKVACTEAGRHVWFDDFTASLSGP